MRPVRSVTHAPGCTGSVRQGTTASAVVAGTRDLGQLVNQVLELPIGRSVLLSPEASLLAIGAQSLTSGRGFISGLFAAYEIVAPAAKAKLLRGFLQELNDQRRKRGLGPVLVQPGLEHARRVTAEQLEAGYGNAVRTLMSALGSQTQTGTRGWTVLVSEVSGIQFPKELLEAQAPRIAVTLALRRPAGTPWTVLQVVVAMATGPNSHMVTL